MSAIISLTTIPDRIEHIKPCIESLMRQGLAVYVWAVRKIERSETVLEQVPVFLRESDAHVAIVEDRGPITKLLPALEAGFETIITADDDIVYGEGWADGLLEWSAKVDGAIGYRGRQLTGTGYITSRVVKHDKIDEPVRVDIITGVHGALYRAEMFGASIFSEWRQSSTNDDLAITAHLERRGVRRYVVPGDCRIKHQKLEYTMPLFDVNNADDARANDKVLRALGLMDA